MWTAALRSPRLPPALAVAVCAGATAWFVLAFDERVLDPLTFLLAGGALIANVLSVRFQGLGGSVWVSASFTSSLLAIALLGPAPAFVVAVVGELGAWVVERFRVAALVVNIAGSGVPNLVAATTFAALLPPDAGGLTFVVVLAVVAALALTLNYAIVTGLCLLGAVDVNLPSLGWPRHLLPAIVWSVAATVTIIFVYRHVPPLGAVTVLVLVLGLTYMLQLVARARRKDEQYAALSCGVLEGLVRTLEQREPRAARHAAAVAQFSYDIARASGLSPAERDLAHTVGLLHDVGKCALSDRVIKDDSGPLTPDDWRVVRRHPELGANMLRELGVYGPVADAVRAHHERPDGRGYPDGARADEIPEAAKIVAVAEAYDTLTAEGSYRRRRSSFEALNELRRVAGTQLEERYVEALAEVLNGRTIEYRHATAADFARELDVERRILAGATR
ncbi:MAG: HD domain-containing protein [Actinomycetota bacterium]|nr:HD domain-containing protein [Actinomycetota bacterium]